MNMLSRSMEQIAIALSLLILSLTALNFALSSQLQDKLEVRFLFSAVVLGLCALYLRFSLQQVTALHRAGYRIALVMMSWAAGLYFFPYPNAVLYLVIIPGLYFLYRIEIKTQLAPMEDKIAAGLLFLLAIFLYIQNQPLQAVLFDNHLFDWHSYYQNAPAALLVGLALIRFQKWLAWDGIATLGSLIVLIAATLSISLINREGSALNELLFLAGLSHLLLAFIFIPNQLFNRFLDFTGVQRQSLNYSASIFALAMFLAQLSLLVLLITYWQDALLVKSDMPFLNDLSPTNRWLLVTLLLNITLPVYSYRHWSISLMFLQLGLVALFLVFTHSLKYFEVNVATYALLFVAILMIAMVLLKRKIETSHWINNWSFIGVLFCYLLIFTQTAVFTPVGLLGFAFPVLAWGMLPDRPFAVARRYEAYLWPVASLFIVLCFSDQPGLKILADWSLVTIAVPLVFFMLLTNQQLYQLMHQRGWTAINLLYLKRQKYLTYYALFAMLLAVSNFFINHPLFKANWQTMSKTVLVLMLSAGAVLYVAIRHRRLSLMLLTEFILWLTMSLIRWKLENIKLLELGSPIDGYLFIAIAVLVAGIREKMLNHSQQLSRYFTKTAIVYGVIGWLYLLYLHFIGGEALHGELASMIMAGLFYWLSRSSRKRLKIMVFIFANIGLFLYLLDKNVSNLMIYLLPAVSSALVLTQMFKDELTDFQVGQIRLYSGLILLGVSAAYNILDFTVSVWYPATAALVSAFVVILGISLRIRIFLYLGSAFILVNLVGMIGNVIISQPPEKTMLAVGVLFLLTGILFVVSYLLFQLKREEIKRKYQAITQTIASWD